MIEKTPYENFQELMDLLLSIDTTKLISVDYMTKGYDGSDGAIILDIYPKIKLYSFTKDDKLSFRRLVENEESRLKMYEDVVEEQKVILKKLKKEILGEDGTEKLFKKEAKKDESGQKEYKKGIWRKDKK
jgi:hypothetical protein